MMSADPHPLPSSLSYEEEPLPPRPEAGDCCNGGCAVCVLEGYEDEVAAWEREVAEINARNAQRLAARSNR